MTPLPQSGDRFHFNGLGDIVGERIITVLSISTSGDVTYRIQMNDEHPKNLHSAPLSEVLLMIAHGVWERIDS